VTVTAGVVGCVSISAIGDPLPDFRVHLGRYTGLFVENADAASVAAMSPLPRIRPGMASVLCTHAVEDKVVPIASHKEFAVAYVPD